MRILFDSARPGDPRSRHSYLCDNPVVILDEQDGFDGLRQALTDHGYAPTDTSDGVFRGGAAGVIGFDGQMRIGIYPDVTHNPVLPEPRPFQPVRLAAEQSDADYEQRIRKVIDYIHAGDIFQACLSRRFSAPRPDGFDPLAHYGHLRRINPAPFSGFVDAGDFTLSCTSPERFLRVTNGSVETRPIKGTLPDHENPESLLLNTKECAENAMIVDLLRNDIARNCTDESVIVTQLNQVEHYEGLYHLVSAIEGQLRPDRDAIDLLRDAFPGGSISGAPKIRAMQIIEEQEPVARGFYCGSLFWIGLDGAMDSNILIRTLITTDERITLHSGGGIVADSIPKKEVEETWVKAAKILESLK